MREAHGREGPRKMTSDDQMKLNMITSLFLRFPGSLHYDRRVRRVLRVRVSPESESRTSGSFLQEIFNLMCSESSDNGKNRTDLSVRVRGGYHACPGKPMKARRRACYHQESRKSSGEGISPFVDPFAVGS